MARIQQTKNTVIPTWKVSWRDVEMSRSKAIEDYDQALKFKSLVEEAGEHMPTLAVLDEHGLIKYGDWIHPGVPVALLKMLGACSSDKEAVQRVRQMLEIMVELPR